MSSIPGMVARFQGAPWPPRQLWVPIPGRCVPTPRGGGGGDGAGGGGLVVMGGAGDVGGQKGRAGPGQAQRRQRVLLKGSVGRRSPPRPPPGGEGCSDAWAGCRV